MSDLVHSANKVYFLYKTAKDHLDSYEDARRVFDSLSSKEKLWVANGNYRESPYTKYRKVYYDGNNPYAYMDVHTHDKKDAIITTAINKKYRGRRITDKMLNDAINKLRRSRVERLLWMADYNNRVSNSVAISRNWGLVEANEEHKTNVYEVPLRKVGVK